MSGTSTTVRYYILVQGGVVTSPTPQPVPAGMAITDLEPADMNWIEVTALMPTPPAQGSTATQAADGTWAFAAPVPPVANATPDPTLTPAQAAENLLQGGAVQIASTSTPGLDGTYGIAPSNTAAITSIVAGISAGAGFPGGAAQLPYPDSSGALHVFPTTAAFIGFGAAIEGYVFALEMIAQGRSAAFPAQPLTIP